MGVDGLTPQISGGFPIQVKQSEDIGRNVIDNFQSAMRRFNKKKGYIVLAATMQLRKGNKAKIQAVAKEHMRYRKERHPLEYPSAGSIFKNCDLKKTPATVQVQFKDVIKTDPFPVIPAAALIARAKLQGMRVGDAEISEKHPNYIVNRGNATANDVLELIARVKKEIKNKFSIDLEEEITFPH